MAEVILCSISLRDYKGDQTTIPVFFPATFTQANIQAWLTSAAPFIDEVTGAVLQSASITLPLTLPGGLTAEAVANDDLQEGANFSFNTVNRYNHLMRLPAIKPAYTAGVSVDITDPDIIAFVGTITVGIDDGGTQVIPSDAAGGDITGLSSAKKTFRKR